LRTATEIDVNYIAGDGKVLELFLVRRNLIVGCDAAAGLHRLSDYRPVPQAVSEFFRGAKSRVSTPASSVNPASIS
jgi:hypothetical protein